MTTNREKLLTLIQEAFYEGGLLLENEALRAAANRFYTAAMYAVMLFLPDAVITQDDAVWRLGSRYLRKNSKIYKTSLEIRKLRGSIEFNVDHEPSLSDVKKLSKLCHIFAVWCEEQTKEPLWNEKLYYEE
jgi:uncharacterized protein (UPF0332 family)